MGNLELLAKKNDLEIEKEDPSRSDFSIMVV